MKPHKLKIYTAAPVAFKTLEGESKMETSPSEELDKLIRAEMNIAYPALSYSAAVPRVLAKHPELAAAYANETGGVVRVHSEEAESAINPDQRLAEKAKELVREGKAKTFAEAAAMSIRQMPMAAREWCPPRPVPAVRIA